MQKKHKIFLGFMLLGLVLSMPNATQADSKYDWKNYFSFEEMISLRRKAADAVKNKFENDSDWKEIIAGKNIKDNAITTSKIKDGGVEATDIATGAVTSAKITDGTIAGNDLASNIDITTTGDGRFDDATIDGDLALLGGGTFSVDGNLIFGGDLTLDSSEMSHAVDFSGASSMTIPRGNGAPTNGDCDSASEIGKIYINTASGGGLYVCTNKQASIGWDTVDLTD